MPQIELNKRKDRVLLVDDEIDVTLLVSEVMSEQGFLVETAASGIDALQKMETFSPDIIISDIKMPGMDGFEFCQRVRDNHEWQDTPFIFLSAVDDIDSIRSSRIAGADEYIVKPYDIIDIILAVQTKLERIRSLRGKYKQEFEKSQLAGPPVAQRLEMLQGFTDMAVSELASAPLQEIRQTLRLLGPQTTSLGRTLRSLLLYFEFKRLSCEPTDTASPPELYKIDVRAMTNDAVQECMPLIRSKTLELSLALDELDHEFHVPANTLKHLFIETLMSAITTAPASTPMRIAVHATKEDLLMSICLDGVKGPEEIRNTTGLTIARAIAEFYGGKYIVQRGLSGGTEYIISLPRS